MAASIDWNGVRWHQRQDGYYANSRHGLLHRAVYEATFGPVPDGRVVHHVNHDKEDNRPGNLQAVTRKQHAEHHPSVYTDAQRAAMERHWKRRRESPESSTCEECGTGFEHVAMVARFCGTGCQQAHYHRTKTGRTWHRRECAVCGAGFDTRWDVRTCSRSCTSKLAYRTRRARLRPDG